MAKNNQIHTVHRPNGWGNIKPGATRPPKLYQTKTEAQSAGRQSAINQKSEHVVHNLNGQISQKNSYGNDPHPPRG